MLGSWPDFLSTEWLSGAVTFSHMITQCIRPLVYLIAILARIFSSGDVWRAFFWLLVAFQITLSMNTGENGATELACDSVSGHTRWLWRILALLVSSIRRFPELGVSMLTWRFISWLLASPYDHWWSYVAVAVESSCAERSGGGWYADLSWLDGGIDVYGIEGS